MKIDVRINSLTPDKGSIKAIASANFGDCLAVKGIKVMEGKNGLFVSMPSQKGKDGNYHDVCFPITPEFRNQLNNAVVQAYQQTISQLQEQKNVGFTQAAQNEVPAMEMSM
ncbi:MAG: SpoVG family protein [Bacteroidales bacterium]|nr:SpoVG family protein [Bacteroidales bacterium]